MESDVELHCQTKLSGSPNRFDITLEVQERLGTEPGVMISSAWTAVRDPSQLVLGRMLPCYHPMNVPVDGIEGSAKATERWDQKCEKPVWHSPVDTVSQNDSSSNSSQIHNPSSKLGRIRQKSTRLLHPRPPDPSKIPTRRQRLALVFLREALSTWRSQSNPRHFLERSS